jgi:hypothetical protein
MGVVGEKIGKMVQFGETYCRFAEYMFVVQTLEMLMSLFVSSYRSFHQSSNHSILTESLTISLFETGLNISDTQGSWSIWQHETRKKYQALSCYPFWGGTNHCSSLKQDYAPWESSITWYHMPIYLPLRTKKSKKIRTLYVCSNRQSWKTLRPTQRSDLSYYVGIGTTLKSHSVDAYGMNSIFWFDSNQKLPQLASGKIRKENLWRAAWDMLHFSDRPISTGYGWAPRQAVQTSRVVIRHVQ